MEVRALVVFALAWGCGHPRATWHEAQNRLCGAGACFRVGDLPLPWLVVQQERAQVGFHNPDTGAVISANATCRDDAEAVPLDRLTGHLLIGYTERRIHAQQKVPLAEREALRTRASAKLDGVPVELELYVLRRNGCIYDLAHVAPPDRFTRGQLDFRRFVGGFVDDRRGERSEPSRLRAGLRLARMPVDDRRGERRGS